MIILNIPFPPSLNTYWRNVSGRVLISKKGRDYRRAVVQQVAQNKPIKGRLSAEIIAFPPDRRRRDLDNMLKAVLDALQHAGVYEDDSQIDSLKIMRSAVVSGGEMEIKIKKLSNAGE